MRPLWELRRSSATFPFRVADPATLPSATTCVFRKCASTRFRKVSPCMPSTKALNSVFKWTGWPPDFTSKSGVSVVPEMSMWSSLPSYFPAEESNPEMPWYTLRSARSNLYSPEIGVCAGSFSFHRPNFPVVGDFPRRFRIVHLQAVSEWAFPSHVAQRRFPNIEAQRRYARLARDANSSVAPLATISPTVMVERSL